MVKALGVEERMNLSLDEIIKKKPDKFANGRAGRKSRPAANTSAKKPIVTTKGKGLGVRSQGIKKQQNSAANKSKAASQKVGGKKQLSKSKSPSGNQKRIVTFNKSRKKVVMPDALNLRVTIKNDKALKGVGQQRGSVSLSSYQAEQQAAYQYQALQRQYMQQATPGYGPRNLQPGGAYGANSYATLQPNSSVPGFGRPALHNPADFGVSRRTLGISLAPSGVVASRQVPPLRDYDNTKTHLRMDYGR